MKDKLRMVLAATALLIGQLSMAQDQKPLSISEAIDLGLKNSRQLKISSAKIDEATASLKEAEQRRLPDASVMGSYIRLTNPNINMKNQSSSGGSTGSTPSVSQAAYGILNASLPIYTGGRIKYGIESARYLAEAVKLDAENDKDAVIENTIEAYANLYKAKAAVNLVKENLTQSQQRVKDLANLEKNGLLPRNELLKAQLQASNTELSLLEVENNWQLANVNMDLMLGLPEKTVIIPDSAFLQSVTENKTLDDFVQSALTNRKDIAALDLRKQAALTGVKTVKGEYYPSLQLTGGYIAADIPKLLTITNAVNVGIGFSYNIGSLWKTKAKVKGAEARANEMAATQELVNDQVRLQVNKAYLNWLNSQKKIEVYAKAIELADENYRVIKNKYANSLATTTDVLEADVAQLQANLNYTFSKADAVVAYHQLLQAAGQVKQVK
jgi:outer membrane protein